MSVKEIESAITQLSAKDLAELMAWLENHYAQMWDKQIEDDLEAGASTRYWPRLTMNMRQG